jgi:hypothetical protein
VLSRVPRLFEWHKRRRLEREIAQLDTHLDKAAAAVTGYRKMEIYQEWDYETAWPRAALGELETKRLVRRAESRALEIPPDEGWWTHHGESDTKYLTNPARARVNV